MDLFVILSVHENLTEKNIEILEGEKTVAVSKGSGILPYFQVCLMCLVSS